MSEWKRQHMFVMAALALVVSTGCAVGLKYSPPQVAAPPAFREALPSGWTDAKPEDGTPRGQWWTVYNDPALDALEDQVAISNQNVLAAEAQYRAARAAVGVDHAGLFPTVSTTPSVAISGAGGVAGTVNRYTIPIDVTYQADVWGSIRRTVAADKDLAQASAADLENARLLYQADLAFDYFQIQGLHAQERLLQTTLESDEQFLQLTQDRFQGGIASQGDVALAQTQVETVRAQLTDLGIAQAQFEHAIAVLAGKLPTDLPAPSPVDETPPPVSSVGLPSTLLERRPDIAAAERQVAAANQEIGVAKSAFFPALTFGGNAGSQALAIADLLTTPTRLWSVGAQLAETIFDGGKRHAQVKVSEAAYDTAVANYKQTVLTGFQQVEDAISGLRTLADEAQIADRAVAAAQQSLNIATIQYRGGLSSYLQVITAQTSLLQNQRTAVDLLTRRLVESVSLIEALGGGWDASQLPSN